MRLMPILACVLLAGCSISDGDDTGGGPPKTLSSGLFDVSNAQVDEDCGAGLTPGDYNGNVVDVTVVSATAVTVEGLLMSSYDASRVGNRLTGSVVEVIDFNDFQPPTDCVLTGDGSVTANLVFDEQLATTEVVEYSGVGAECGFLLQFGVTLPCSIEVAATLINSAPPAPTPTPTP